MTREELKAWLDRAPPSVNVDGYARAWWDWFGKGFEYLGERSARTGPDQVIVPDAHQKCTCSVCEGGR